MEDGEFLTGKMLIAMPGIGDPRFERALVLICAHDAGHAMGVAVNRPVEGRTLPDLLTRLEVEPTSEMSPDLVLLGGPVDRERGFVLHTDDYMSGDHTLQVGQGVALTATREVLEAVAGPQPPRRAVLALGYAGWGPGQLERELRENVWLTCEADENLIFGAGHARKWSDALAKLGVDPRLLSSTAGSA